MRMLRYTISLFLLLVTLLLMVTSSAEESTTPDASVDSSIDISIIDGASVSVEFTADVSYITLPAIEKKYSREDIQGADLQILGAIKYALKSDIVSQLKASFPHCHVSSLYELPQYESGFFIDKYNISLTAGFFSMNESVSSFDVVNGLLDAGVYINYTFPWTALPGWNNTYTLILSNELDYIQTTGGSVDNKKISWDVLNGAGTIKEKQGSVKLKDLFTTTDPSENESMSFIFSLDCQNPKKPELSFLLQAHRLTMNDYSLLPSILTLPSSIPSDAVRLCITNNLSNYEEIKERSFNDYIDIALNALRQSSFNQSFNISFLWNEQTTTNCSPLFVIDKMNEFPPIEGVLFDPFVQVRFHSISARAFFGLINAGATSTVTSENVNFADVFDSVSIQSSANVKLPPHVLYNQSSNLSWNQSEELYGNFESDNAPFLSSQTVTREHVINIKSTDLNLLSFFTGKTEVNLGIGFEKTRNIFVLNHSSALSIPSAITLPYLSADAFRLCVEENVFSESEIEQYIIRHESELENMSKGLFPSIKGSAITTQKIYEESLQWDENISNMTADNPVIIHQHMESTAPLSCVFSLFPPQFSFKQQNLTFIGVPEETVTYNMTFPKGVHINVLSSSQKIDQTTAKNGNELLSVRLNASEIGKVATVLISMEPSLLYVIGLFVPCILSVFITIILFIVVYIIRKKRNMLRQNNQVPSSSEESNEYENEDYYVPPKPPSSR